MSGGVDSSVVAALLEAGGLRRRRHHAPALRPWQGGRPQGRVLRRPGHSGRPAGGGGASHPPLRARLRDPIRRGGDGRVRRQLSCRRDAGPLRLLQPEDQVQGPVADGRRSLAPQALATGHYVKSRPGPSGFELYRARDAERDQSYFLFATTREQLDFLRFPLGDLEKEETRKLAREFGLVTAEKSDSQDICFVPTGPLHPDHRAPAGPGAAEAGDIVHVDGRVLGRHRRHHQLHHRPAPRHRRGRRGAALCGQARRLAPRGRGRPAGDGCAPATSPCGT